MSRIESEISDRLLKDEEVVHAIAWGVQRGQKTIDLIKRVRDITIEVKDEVLDD